MSISSNERVRWLATAAVVVLVVLILLTSVFKPGPSADATLLVRADDRTASSSEPATTITSPTPTAGARIGVDVIGAVQQPGVYYLDAPARIVDAVQAAGGFMPDADRERINLASHVSDGQQVRVPRVGEQSSPNAAPTESAASDGSGSRKGMVNINQADIATLDDITGIGPATAEAIVEYRTSNGPFKQIEDVQDVKGIGPALFGEIKDQITVDP